jgi:hypothetical protein
MAKKKEAKALDTTTEAKIKNAARVVFHKKGLCSYTDKGYCRRSGH